MNGNNYKFSSLTGSIIGCAMEVHNTPGNGFREVIYQRTLEIEFRNKRIPYHRELTMPVNYKGSQIGNRRVDFLEKTLLCRRLGPEYAVLLAEMEPAKALLVRYSHAT
ncbi:MAG: GxxExxY protein [Balneolaceae bacterium]|nr:GxxExxY protein [Balneolaceae bacterium]